VIVFPMAGQSLRFQNAGYKKPKFMLELGGKSVLHHVVEGFSALFQSEEFMFIFQNDPKIRSFVMGECERLGLPDPLTAGLDQPTRGQAETVFLGLERTSTGDAEPLTIFNVDTLRPGFCYPATFDLMLIDGYLEVFKGSGDGWSFVRPRAGDGGRVAETAEKNPISDLCCTGLYHFRSAKLFAEAFRAACDDPGWQLVNGEYYVAPLYNRLIADGADIRYHLIGENEVEFCGTPAQYEQLQRRQETDDA
jgi:hypothetical protein|tara:strand:- start:1159 stop:1908 length:750 start_codon:yes stop_codon:yes gene_type:complete